MRTVNHGPYEATLLHENFWSIDQGFVRSFLICGTERAMLVDTCDANDDLPGLVRQLTDLPLVVVQTHCDHDHIGASGRFDTVHMHPSEFALLRETCKKPLNPRPLREGETVHLGGRSFEVILIPGHTPGSIALLDEKARVLLSGDTVKEDIVYMFGPGRDVPAYIHSLESLYAMRHRYDTVLACHGEMPITAERIPNLIEGAKRLWAGELEGIDDGCGMPCKLYTYKTARFYY